MDWIKVEKNWAEMQSKVKAQWTKLTDEQLKTIAGKRTELVSNIEKAYAIKSDAAEEQVKAFEKKCDDDKTVKAT